ncbi:hypothetical protein [Streptococcus sp.]|uniref:hypothetical protein n=1 Tax=Streptococcus sp. TaxID=1306 RepID=UPI0035A0803E
MIKWGVRLLMVTVLLFLVCVILFSQSTESWFFLLTPFAVIGFTCVNLLVAGAIEHISDSRKPYRVFALTVCAVCVSTIILIIFLVSSRENSAESFILFFLVWGIIAEILFIHLMLLLAAWVHYLNYGKTQLK